MKALTLAAVVLMGGVGGFLVVRELAAPAPPTQAGGAGAYAESDVPADANPMRADVENVENVENVGNVAGPALRARVIERTLTPFEDALLKEPGPGVNTKVTAQEMAEKAAWEAAVECSRYADDAGARVLQIRVELHAARELLVLQTIDLTGVESGAPLPDAMLTCLRSALERPRTHRADTNQGYLEIDTELQLTALLPAA